MAARNSAGPVWIILLLVVGNVSLAVTAFCAWQNKVRAEQRSARAASERDQAKKAQEIALGQLRTLRQKINHESDLGFAEVLQAIKDDLRQFGTGTPNETYGDIVRHLQTLVDTHRTEIEQITADKERLQEDFET